MNPKAHLQSFVLDSHGGARTIPPGTVAKQGPGEVHWLHLDYQDPATVAWLQEQSGIDDFLIEALCADDPRPRSLVHGDGLLVILRAANQNPGSDPDDMVSLRLWLERDRVLTFRHRRLHSVEEVAQEFAGGNGPTSAGDLLAEIVSHILSEIGEVVVDIEDNVDDLEELVLTATGRELRTRLSDLRRKSIALRRFVAPQRDTIGRLYAERVSWLDDMTRAQLRESADRSTRYIEDLDSARERAAVTYEELTNRLAEQMNETMYRLSIVAAIFLPLGLLTGLLGINVGGMPGTDSPMAFTIVTIGLVLIGLIEWRWFRGRTIL